jgi:hypothetical protein
LLTRHITSIQREAIDGVRVDDLRSEMRKEEMDKREEDVGERVERGTGKREATTVVMKESKVAARAGDTVTGRGDGVVAVGDGGRGRGANGRRRDCSVVRVSFKDRDCSMFTGNSGREAREVIVEGKEEETRETWRSSMRAEWRRRRRSKR